MRRRHFLAGLTGFGFAATLSHTCRATEPRVTAQPSEPSLAYVFAVASRVCRAGARSAPYDPRLCFTEYPVVLLGSKRRPHGHLIDQVGLHQPLMCSRPIHQNALGKLAQLSQGLKVGGQMIKLHATAEILVFFYRRQTRPSSRIAAAEQFIERWREALNVPELRRV